MSLFFSHSFLLSLSYDAVAVTLPLLLFICLFVFCLFIYYYILSLGSLLSNIPYYYYYYYYQILFPFLSIYHADILYFSLYHNLAILFK